MSKIGMPAFTLKKQHSFDHFEIHIFAKTHVFFMLKNRGCFSVHVLTTTCTSAQQDNKKNTCANSKWVNHMNKNQKVALALTQPVSPNSNFKSQVQTLIAMMSKFTTKTFIWWSFHSNLIKCHEMMSVYCLNEIMVFALFLQKHVGG